MKTISVILAGGIGKRLEPFSSDTMPKQFLKYKETKKSFFQITLDLASNISGTENTIISTNKNFESLINNEISNLNNNILDYSFIYEYVSRNTAVSFLLSSFYALEKFGDNKIIFFPSDHILEINEFKLEIIESLKTIDNKSIYCFGKKANKVISEFGYFSYFGNKVLKFIEKPDTKEIDSLSIQGLYCNTGIYFGYITSFIKQFKEISPIFFKTVKHIFDKIKKHNVLYFNNDTNELLSNISFDNLISTKTKHLKFFEMKSYWNDIGNFENFWSECSVSNKMTLDLVIDTKKLSKFIDTNNNFSYKQSKNKTIIYNNLNLELEKIKI